MNRLFAPMFALALACCTVLAKQASPTAPTQVGIINHSGTYIYSAAVDGAGGANITDGDKGLADVCCTSIPRVLQPGMKVLLIGLYPRDTLTSSREKALKLKNSKVKTFHEQST